MNHKRRKQLRNYYRATRLWVRVYRVPSTPYWVGFREAAARLRLT